MGGTQTHLQRPLVHCKQQQPEELYYCFKHIIFLGVQVVKDHTISNHTGWTILRAMATRKGEKLVGISISPSYILLVNHADKRLFSSHPLEVVKRFIVLEDNRNVFGFVGPNHYSGTMQLFCFKMAGPKIESTGDDVHAGYTRSWDKMLSKKNAVKYVTVSQVKHDKHNQQAQRYKETTPSPSSASKGLQYASRIGVLAMLTTEHCSSDRVQSELQRRVSSGNPPLSRPRRSRRDQKTSNETLVSEHPDQSQSGTLPHSLESGEQPPLREKEDETANEPEPKPPNGRCKTEAVYDGGTATDLGRCAWHGEQGPLLQDKEVNSS